MVLSLRAAVRVQQDNIVPALHGRPTEEKPLTVLLTKKVPKVFLLEVTLNPLQKEENSKMTCAVYPGGEIYCVFFRDTWKPLETPNSLTSEP